MKTLQLSERLVVAADFRPEGQKGRKWVRDQVKMLAKDIKGTGVPIKVNSALRACGYELIELIHSFDLKVMADLKLVDIASTLETDGALLMETAPDFLTVYCATGHKAISGLRQALMGVELIGVTVLTDFDNHDSVEIFGESVQSAVSTLAEVGVEAGLHGLVASASEASFLREKFCSDITINTPAIRPAWSMVKDDNQNPARIMTPYKAIKAGADRIIVGRPILEEKNRYDAVMRTLEEIQSALL